MISILVIEDERTIRENIAELLTYEGYTVRTAENGVAGVTSARSMLPNLILCDIMMSEMDGYGVLATLRGQPATRGIPFLFLTAKTKPMGPPYVRGWRWVETAYLGKPHSVGDLLDAITKHLGKHPSLDQLPSRLEAWTEDPFSTQNTG